MSGLGQNTSGRTEPNSLVVNSSGGQNASLNGSGESSSLVGKAGEETAPDSKHLKLTVFTGTVFIVGEMAGSGMLALPKAIENTGWIGLVLLVVFCVAVGYCGILLGKCWLMLEERFPVYREHCRNPYASIGYECYGNRGRILVSVCLDITMFGVPVVFLILASENLHEIFDKVPGMNFSACYWMLILSAILIPLVWLGTPQDFWPIAIGATVSTGLACIILVADIGTNPVSPDPAKVPHNGLDVKNFALAFGTILFSFGGAPAFPTIQHDMRNTADFPKAVFFGFCGLFVMYFPVSIVGYLFLGNTLTDNILTGLGDTGGKNWMYYTVQALIVIHLIPALVIVINPLCQELELLLKLPLRFTWKRAVMRTLCVLTVLFVAESVPRFGPILSLIGGSTNTLLCIVLPCIFYLKLCSLKRDDWPKRQATLHEWIFSIEIILVGIIGGAITTYSAIDSIANPATFLPPCYLNVTLDSS